MSADQRGVENATANPDRVDADGFTTHYFDRVRELVEDHTDGPLTPERCAGCGSELGFREVHVHDEPTLADAIVEPKVARDRQVAGSHYQTEAGIQPWDVIEAYGLDFYRGNALKYLLRAGRKANTTALDDLRKCAHYLERIIEIEEGKS